MKKRYPIGVDNFKEIIDEDLYFVDKTMFIKEIIDDGSKVILIARPRRFGKTLNMSMLKYYFQDDAYMIYDKTDKNLFEKFEIWKQDDFYKKEYKKYAVINLTFKDIKMSTWEKSYKLIQKTITEEYMKHDYILDSDKVKPSEKQAFEEICYGKGDESDYVKSLKALSSALYKHYDTKVIILIDEYDTLLNEAYINGYYKEAIEFIRVFLNAGLKNNEYLHKAVLTGIFRVAKESIFSDMNNLNVCTILNDDYREQFGFTQDEVKEMLTYYEIDETMANMSAWYNGYLFGKKEMTTIYNPWSIMLYIKNKSLGPYWINTSGNAIIKQIAVNAGESIQNSIQDLLNGGVVENIKIDENIIYNEIMNKDNNIWSFLLMSGYLKVIDKEWREDGIYYTLCPPNKEIFYFYRNMIESWLSETVRGGSVEKLLKALITGDIETFEDIFSNTVMQTVSVYDTGQDTSENFYHAFVLGILVNLDKDYEIKSNRESGIGRYDVMIIPKATHKKGIVIEFKRASKKESLEEALDRAKKQLAQKKYETELIQRGIEQSIRLAIAFKGKEVMMEMEEIK